MAWVTRCCSIAASMPLEVEARHGDHRRALRRRVKLRSAPAPSSGRTARARASGDRAKRAGALGLAVGDEVAVGQLHRLRQAGRAARPEQAAVSAERIDRGAEGSSAISARTARHPAPRRARSVATRLAAAVRAHRAARNGGRARAPVRASAGGASCGGDGGWRHDSGSGARRGMNATGPWGAFPGPAGRPRRLARLPRRGPPAALRRRPQRSRTSSERRSPRRWPGSARMPRPAHGGQRHIQDLRLGPRASATT